MTPVAIALFLGAAAVAPLARAIAALRFGERVEIRVDPVRPSAKHLAECFAAVAVALDERPRALRVAVKCANGRGRRFRLVDGRDRVFSVELDGDRPAKLDLRGRWIADHPLPLEFDPRGRTVLRFRPVEANRFRVDVKPPFAIPRFVPFALLAVGLHGALALEPATIALAVGGALGIAATLSFDR